MKFSLGPDTVELQQWFQEAAQQGGGQGAPRRNVAVYILDRDDQSTLRSITCFECFPVGFDAGDPASRFRDSDRIPYLHRQPDRSGLERSTTMSVEVDTAVAGFRVEINGQSLRVKSYEQRSGASSTATTKTRPRAKSGSVQ
jgi:hypothetical protein